ncbi:hypothetical protein [Nonomuraea longispora]|uniref:hypothetical protein n=1 Tax=Nonomuraea longispora TaxID=1848320 RepID=UPI001404DFB8|nr:hypothetical protein [Nonomuraea longispora]
MPETALRRPIFGRTYPEILFPQTRTPFSFRIRGTALNPLIATGVHFSSVDG